MANTNSESNSYSYLSTVTYQPTIYDRITKMAEIIGDIKTELAIEKKLLNLEKIRHSYIQQNKEIEELSGQSYVSSHPYEGKFSQHILNYPKENYPQEFYINNPYYFVQEHGPSLYDNINMSNSERQILENRKKMQQLAIHDQLSNLEKRFNLEKKNMQQNMDTLYRMSEMVLSKNERKRRVPQ